MELQSEYGEFWGFVFYADDTFHAGAISLHHAPGLVRIRIPPYLNGSKASQVFWRSLENVHIEQRRLQDVRETFEEAEEQNAAEAEETETEVAE